MIRRNRARWMPDVDPNAGARPSFWSKNVAQNLSNPGPKTDQMLLTRIQKRLIINGADRKNAG
jgi:hypothetical protein